jgi:hypothetical protein
LPDSLHGLFPDRPDLAAAARPDHKMRLDPEGTETRKRLPVAAFLFLESPAPQGTVRLGPMTKAEVAMGLISNAFALDPGDPEHARRKMADCAAAAQAVPGLALHYPRHYGELAAIREAILAHPAIADYPTQTTEAARQ